VSKAYSVSIVGWMVLCLCKPNAPFPDGMRGLAPIFWTREAAEKWLAENELIEDEREDVQIVEVTHKQLVVGAAQ